MEEVENYIKDFLGFTEVKQNTDKYQTEYSEMRASFLLQYAPELLGELATFDIDLHIFEKMMQIHRCSLVLSEIMVISAAEPAVLRKI
jgi:hypothetical protein